MRYIRLEKATTKYIDERKTVHSVSYRTDFDQGPLYGPIRWQHIQENVRKFKWEAYELFQKRGEYWFWNDTAFASFSDAYNEASKSSEDKK